MDLLSYKLGKKSSGGGGGGGGEITEYFETEPNSITLKVASLIKSIPMIDTTKLTNASGMFQYCSRLTSIPAINTSKVTTMYQMFEECAVLKSVPQLNTSSVTNMSFMFSGCYALETVPVFNASKVTNVTSMFQSCTNLTDESVDNILQMCAGATAYTGTKTLYSMGFRSGSYPASRIQALGHYQDFIDAGWTIGY